MTLEEVKAMLWSNNLKFSHETRLPNETGWQIKVKTGQIINVFDKGTINVQGKNSAAVKKLFPDQGSPAKGLPQDIDNRQVFVVYGHDQNARNQLEAMLRRWHIEPLILDQLPSEGMTIIEKLEHYQKDIRFAVVLATPDDEGHRASRGDEKAYRARQNVVLELGMMLTKLGRSRVAILLKDQEKMERPSDIQGLIYIPFKDDVAEAALPLAKEMNAQGLSIDLGRI